jgi:cytoskeletal protein CcmA (bactofilin family)
MFKETKTKENTVFERNVIAKKTVIKGEISSEGDFRIDGTVEGTVKAKGRVIIGKEGRIEGAVECSNADVEGEVSGNLLVANMLTLKATSNVSGDVIIGKLTVEPGANFNATCSMKGVVKELVNNEQEKSEEKTA